MPPVEDVVVCPVCGHLDLRLAPGPGGRPSAACTACGSLERHRALTGLLPVLASFADQGCVLDVAPTPLVSGVLQKIASDRGSTYVGMDLDPGADGRQVTLRASMTELPLADRSVGLSVCFHVLEHIPDDRAAMREMARTVSDRGVYLVQVPRRSGPTDEDPDAPEAERVRRFGQADHVRYYGDDFEDRLRESGLEVLATTLGELFGERALGRLGMAASEPLWFCAARSEVLDIASVRSACEGFALDSVSRAAADSLRRTSTLVAERRNLQTELAEVSTRLRRVRERSRECRARVLTLRERLEATREELRRARRRGSRGRVRAIVRRISGRRRSDGRSSR